MAGENDCVFCNNERDNAPGGEAGGWCAHFEEPIADNAGYVPHSGTYSHSGQARRSKDSCPGFSLHPSMAARWKERFG